MSELKYDRDDRGEEYLERERQKQIDLEVKEEFSSKKQMWILVCGLVVFVGGIIDILKNGFFQRPAVYRDIPSPIAVIGGLVILVFAIRNIRKSKKNKLG
jgi:hypothetical protein